VLSRQKLLIGLHHQINKSTLPSPAVPKSNMKTIVSFKLFTPATPVKSKLNSCQAFAAVTPTDSFRMLLQLLQILIKFFTRNWRPNFS
jgi:hypothetical protein